MAYSIIFERNGIRPPWSVEIKIGSYAGLIAITMVVVGANATSAAAAAYNIYYY